MESGRGRHDGASGVAAFVRWAPYLAMAIALVWVCGKGWAGEDGQSGAPQGRDSVVVLPLVTAGLDTATVSDLNDTIVRILGTYPGIEVRAYAADSPPDRACVGSASCLHELGVDQGAAYLLLGIARQAEARIGVTLILFDVDVSKPVQRVSVDLSGTSSRFSRMLRPIIHEIAMAAGGGTENAVAGTHQENGPGRATTSSEVSPSAGGGEGAQDSVPTSLDALMDMPVSETSSQENAPVSGEVDAAPSVASGSTSSIPSTASAYPNPDASLSDKERLKQERKRRKAMEREARKENKRREKERKELERQREAELKAAALAAEEKRKQELLEAKRRRLEEERRRKEEEKRRAINQKRARKGLPPLPEPETKENASATDTILSAEKPVAAASSAEGATSGAGVSHSPGVGPAGPGFAGPGSQAESPIFLENESPWQVGTFGGLSYFVGFGLLGTGLEVAYSKLPWLWVEAAFESLHAKNPDTALWFYLFNARAGAIARKVDGPLHPYGGLDAVVLLFGRSAWAAGGTARAGLDVMVSRGVGLRIELAAGGLHSPILTNDVYQYPYVNNLYVRFGLGVRYRF